LPLVSMVKGYEYALNSLIDLVIDAGTTEDAIACLDVHDRLRKRLDRVQADPPRYQQENRYR
jgi:hypothetical protein